MARAGWSWSGWFAAVSVAACGAKVAAPASAVPEDGGSAAGSPSGDSSTFTGSGGTAAGEGGTAEAGASGTSTDARPTDTSCGNICAGARCPSVVATGQTSPGPIAVDVNNVYWANDGTASNNGIDGTVMKVALQGGPVITLASGQNAPSSIAVDATNVYWVTSAYTTFIGSVMKVPIAGGTPTALATDQHGPIALAVDSSSVYWTTVNSVMKMPIEGGTATTLASGQSDVRSIAIDSTNVYWTNAGDSGKLNGYSTLMRVPIGGGTPVTLASADKIEPTAVAVDATNIYWARMLDKTVVVQPIAGGPATTLESAQILGGIRAQAGIVYWANEGSPGRSCDGTIGKLAIDGGTSTVLASGQHSPWDVAVDATSIYWANAGDGTIMKMPKD